MRRLALCLVLLLTACTGNGFTIGLPPLGLFPATLDDSEFHAEVFSEAYRRMVVYSLAPVDLAQAVPKALTSLKKIDPGFTPQISNPPGPRDWNGWGKVTIAALETSPRLSTMPPEEVYQPFFAALLGPLDNFSHYLPPEEAEHEAEWKNGYGGIGVTFERKGSQFAIVDVFIGSPADKAGLRAGEMVLAIDDVATGRLSIQDFADMVRGPIGSSLTLSVAAPGQAPRNVVVYRAKVIPTTVSLTLRGHTAIIRISRFVPGTVNEFRRAARQASYSGARAVVLDLQHNPGGILESATEIAALLAPKGLVSYTKGRHTDAFHEYRTDGTDLLQGLPLFVLVDGHSASAAEVLAAALQDTGRAQLIGSTTYGKASVQNVGPLPNGSELAITWAHLYSPTGNTWSDAGLPPNICVLQQNPCPKADDVEALTLPKALEIVEKQGLSARLP